MKTHSAVWLRVSLVVLSCSESAFGFDNLAAGTSTVASSASSSIVGLPTTLKASFTGAAFFPNNIFKGFFPGFGPSQTSVQPQPMITSPVNGQEYPLSLTDPDNIQQNNNVDPVTFPPSFVAPETSKEIVKPLSLPSLSTPETRELAAKAITQIVELVNNSAVVGNCAKCIAGLGIAQQVALTAPWEIPNMLIDLCNLSDFDAFGSCQSEFEANSDGAISTQILALADINGGDGEYICAHIIDDSCPRPTAIPLDLTEWFAKPKPANAVAPPPSGETVKVLHLSDFHLDPRYKTGSEADCSQFLCCRSTSNNTHSIGTILEPAPRFGAFFCDTPMDLAGIVAEAIPALLGTDFSFTIFTGDLTSHDNDNQLSELYVEYEMDTIFTLIKEAVGGGPVYAALGNHDTYPQAFAAPNSLIPSYLGQQFSWDYNHAAALWETLGWISEDVAKVSKATYGGYSTIAPGGRLRIITINTDFWYVDNWFNFVNSSNPDQSGTLRFLTDELQAAEDAGQRAYVIGHVLSGWSGSNAVPNPSNLFYQIIDRFSPHVVAGIFFGHTHEDQLSIFYTNNATVISADTAQAVSWVGPSITPLSNLNAGFRMYEVDAQTFDIMESFTWFSNVSAFAALDSQDKVGASFNFEYSAREAYGANINWPSTSPLNATWWHLVTEQMETNPSLANTFNTFQGKMSVKTTNCTSSACTTAKVCYMRSGSNPIATENCSGEFSSVQ